MRIAFKEWAIVIDALALGSQIIILRKGGISEGPDGFKMEHPEFLLFPTLFHQQRDSVLPPAQARFDEIHKIFPAPNQLRIEYFCRVIESRRLDNPAHAARLESQHIWRPEVIAERFDWGKSKSIFALAVQTYRLPRPYNLPMLPTYGGCKSWIELDQDISTDSAQPVLQDDAFAKRLEAFQSALA